MSSPRTLVVFHKQLGDLLLLEPAVSALAAKDGTPVGILTRGGHEPLVRLFKNAIWMPRPGLRRFHAVWGFDCGRKTAFCTRIRRADAHILRLDPDAVPDGYHRMFFKDVRTGRRERDYIARYYWKMTDPPKDAVFSRPRLLAPPVEWKVPPGIPERYLLANVTAGWRSKCWNAGSWAEALGVLASTTGLPVVLAAGSQDWQWEHAKAVHAALSGSINLAGKTSLGEFIRLIHGADLVLTVDGFAGHLATAYDIPCVTLFGGGTVRNWFCATDFSKAVVASEILGEGVKLGQLPVAPVVETAKSLFISGPRLPGS